MSAPTRRFSIGRITPSDAPAIARLNERLRLGGDPHVVYGTDDGLPDDAPLPRERLYVVRDGDEIRAAAYLKEVQFRIRDETVTLGWVKYPVAESLVDKRFANAPAGLVLDLMRRRPLLAAVGMGGHDGSFAQLLQRLGWQGDDTPTLIFPVDLAAIARALPAMRPGLASERIATYIGRTGLGNLGSLVLSPLARAYFALRHAGARAESFDSFGTWATIGNREIGAEYPAVACRDARHSNWMSPLDVPGARRLRIALRDATVGWAVVQTIDRRNVASSDRFSGLRVGVLHELFSRLEHAPQVIAAAVRDLLDQKVQVVIAQHSHAQWQVVLRRMGFIVSPARFGLYVAPALAAHLQASQVSIQEMFVTRNDDGIHRD